MAKKDGKSKAGTLEDVSLWHQVTKGIAAYTPQKRSAAKTSPPVSSKRGQPPPPLPSPVKRPEPIPAGFDRATETKLRKGKLSLEGRLDLHGMTQQKAFEALHRFILAASKNGKRTVLIITGKGSVGENGGVLRRHLPDWLLAPLLRPYILAVTPAQPKDGGTGAFYVRLRKTEIKDSRPRRQ